MPELCKERNQKKLPQTAIYLGGFAAGILIPNLIWKNGWHKKTMSAGYLFRLSFQESWTETIGIVNKTWLWEVIRKRSGLFLITMLSGLTSFGIPWAVMLLFLCGAEMGFFMTLSILEFGGRGGLLGISYYFPQLLVYLPVLFTGTELVCEQSERIWRNHGLYPRQTWKYLIRAAVLLLVYTIGILLEAWLNPIFLRLILKSIIL